MPQWATGSKKYSENLKLLQNAPYGLGRSKNEIWVKFEEKKFWGKFSDFFKIFQDFPYDFTLKYPKITWAIVGHVNFWVFLNPYSLWVIKKLNKISYYFLYGCQVTLCVAR